MAKALFRAMAAMAFATLAPSAAQAVTIYNSYNFSFSDDYIVSSTLNQNTFGNSITFRSVTDAALRVKVTAWSIDQKSSESDTSGDIVTQAMLKLWDGGLGVRNIYEDSSSPNHAIDNGTGTRNNPNDEYDDNRQMVDFVLMQFNWDVDINSIATGWVSGDWDASLRVGPGPVANPANWNVTPSLNNAKVFGSTSAVELSDYVNMADTTLDSTGSTSSYSRNVNSGNQHGMIWLLGALYGTQDDDFFKLDLINVKVFPTIPEPSTWLTMILGFGFIGGTMRRRKPVAGRGAAALA